MDNIQETGKREEKCPYDPQQMPFPEIIEKLIDAVEVSRAASHSVSAYLDLLYWKGVALARDAHMHPPCQSGARVKRKAGTWPDPLFDEVLRSSEEIADDEVRTVVRVIFVRVQRNMVWHLEFKEDRGRIFAEDQFDLVTHSIR